MFRILLVDDEQALSVLAAVLLPLPCTLELAANPERALQKARLNEFNLVISAYRLPEMNGMQLIKELKALQPGLEAMMLSGFADLREIKQAAAGTAIHRCLTKPLNKEQLLAEVSALIAAGDQTSVALSGSGAKQTKIFPEQGALAALERKYPGITKPNSEWALRRD